MCRLIKSFSGRKDSRWRGLGSLNIPRDPRVSDTAMNLLAPIQSNTDKNPDFRPRPSLFLTVAVPCPSFFISLLFIVRINNRPDLIHCLS